jgi:hypothetical protein
MREVLEIALCFSSPWSAQKNRGPRLKPNLVDGGFQLIADSYCYEAAMRISPFKVQGTSTTVLSTPFPTLSLLTINCAADVPSSNLSSPLSNLADQDVYNVIVNACVFNLRKKGDTKKG